MDLVTAPRGFEYLETRPPNSFLGHLNHVRYFLFRDRLDFSWIPRFGRVPRQTADFFNFWSRWDPNALKQQQKVGQIVRPWELHLIVNKHGFESLLCSLFRVKSNLVSQYCRLGVAEFRVSQIAFSME
jgi:hypothetical protein